MLFNSFPFVFLFLPLTLLLYYGKLVRLQPKIVLLLFSGIFYAVAQPDGLPLLGASILCNWYLSRRIQACSEEARGKRKLWLLAGLALNIGLLCWFKYLDFIVHTLGTLTRLHVSLRPHIFPLGISFFTLQQVMYLVDCYEDMVPANGLVSHAAFVSFFP